MPSDTTQSEFRLFRAPNNGRWTIASAALRLSADDIARINPNTKTAPIFRSRADAELTAKIYARVPVLIDEAKGTEGNPWGASFMRHVPHGE